MATVFAIANRASKDTQKMRAWQREQFLKEDKAADVQRESQTKKYGVQ